MNRHGWRALQLRRLAHCWDSLRIPLNAEERAARPGDTPYWGANSIQGYVDEALVNEEVVLIGEDGAPFFDCDRPVAFRVNEPIWPNNHIHVLKPRPAVDAAWLAYALNDVDYSLYVGGSTRDKLTQSALLSIALLVPTPAEQRDIASFLDRETAKIDAMVAEQEGLIQVLNERRKAVLDAVTSTATGPRVRMRYLFQPSSEANHPDEDVLSVYRDYGVIPKASRDDNFNRTPENVQRYLLVRPGDLVVNRMKAWQGSLGVSGHRGIVSADYEVLRPRDSRLLPRFAHLFLRSPRMVAEYAVRSTGIRPSQWRLYWDELGSIEMPVPPIEVQRRIADYLDDQTNKIDALIAEAEGIVSVAKERRSALITAVVTGQIDVRGEVA